MLLKACNTAAYTQKYMLSDGHSPLIVYPLFCRDFLIKIITISPTAITAITNTTAPIAPPMTAPADPPLSLLPSSPKHLKNKY